jgi:hypothetical protein
MIRTIITPSKESISFDIPKDYVGKQIEVIAFAKDEGLTKDQSGKKQVSFTILHVNNKDYKFNRDEANER